MTTGGPPSAEGEQPAVVDSDAPAQGLFGLYGQLRAELLSRHFALGRYFRADHLSFYNNLGVVHQAFGGRKVSYLDAARHVHQLSMGPAGRWVDADLTGQTNAPHAMSGLSGYGWAGGSEQTVYCDADGHIHELSLSGFGSPWADADLTVQAEAPPAAPESALSGYAWAAGNSKQVVYLDPDGYIHELSMSADSGQWMHDLISPTGVPPAAGTSPLSGYEWGAGNSKQVAYIDVHGFVHELSKQAGGQWADTQLTRPAGPTAWELSPLSGYEWADGNSKQVVFINVEGHVLEFSKTVGGQWAFEDLTHRSGGPIAGPRSRLSGYQWAAGRSKHVAYLDAGGNVQELSRTVRGEWVHAPISTLAGAPPGALGRALSGYQFDGGTSKQVVYLDGYGNVLGLYVTWNDQASPPQAGSWQREDLTLDGRAPVARSGSPLSGFEWPGATENLLIHGCLWSPSQAVVAQPTTVYSSASALLSLPAEDAAFDLTCDTFGGLQRA